VNAFLHEWILTLILAVPCVAATLLFLVPADNKRAVRVLGVGAALLTSVLSLWLLVAYDQHAAGFQFLQRLPWVPSLGIS